MEAQVAHVNLARGYRGGERQAELLIRALTRQAIRQVLVARAGSPLVQRLADVDVEVRAGSGNLLAAFAATRGADIVHAHEGLTRNAYRRATFVASVAADIAGIVHRYDPHIRGCVIHSSSSDLSVDPNTSQSIRGAFQGKWLIGNVGALDNAQKGQEYIIDVARRLENSHPQLQFILVGGGEDEAMLRERAGGLSNVVFTGFVDNVGDYLAAFDLFILPSNKEGIGGILLDAMDQALPIIASRVGGLPEIVRDGENGLLIDARSPEQLQQAILRLHDDPELCSSMGARGRQFSTGFTADVMCEKYLELYRQALAAGPGI
jgi:glycosyltransferase involved in cell wall biosynthesis